jgi:hypothetical protein
VSADLTAVRHSQRASCRRSWSATGLRCGCGVVEQLASHRPRAFNASITAACSQPAWHLTSTLPSKPALMESEGVRSS